VLPQALPHVQVRASRNSNVSLPRRRRLRTCRVGLTSLVAGLAWLAAPSFAHAQEGGGVTDNNGEGFDTHLFRPALDSKGFFHTNGTSVIAHKDISFGLVLDYGNSLLRVPDVGQKNDSLAAHSFQGTFHFNYGLFNRAIIGVSLPVNLMLSGAQVDGQGQPLYPNRWSTAELNSQTIGAPALHTKIKILRVEDGFGLAASLQGGVTLTDAPKKGGADPGFYVWPQLIAEKRFGGTGWFRVGANAGFRAHPASSTELQLQDGTFRDGQRVTYGLGLAARVAEPLELVADTYGTYLVSSADAKVKPSNEVVGGIKLYFNGNSYFMMGAGTRYTPGFEAATIRGFIGFVFEPSIGDRDGDGIKDDVDKCPDVREDFDGVEDEDGCPEADQIRRDIPDADGQPQAFSQCPEGQELNDKEVCAVPPKGDVAVGEGGLVLFKKIKFKTDSAEILPESNDLLDQIASVIKAHGEILLMEVAGHADERAPDQYNLQLTQRRVDSVVAALVKRGVEKSRLRSKGYGEYCPEDPGHNEEAWEKNRRVEFKIVKNKDGGSPPVLGCDNASRKGVKPDPIPQ
jgi:outer membrane protein OmpA-like peptidoglycan-associated protein